MFVGPSRTNSIDLLCVFAIGEGRAPNGDNGLIEDSGKHAPYLQVLCLQGARAQYMGMPPPPPWAMPLVLLMSCELLDYVSTPGL